MSLTCFRTTSLSLHIAATALLLSAPACDGGNSDDTAANSVSSSGSGENGSDSENGSGEEDGTTGATSATTTDDSASSSDSGSFVNVDMAVDSMCSPTLQDCAEGQKCTANSTEGASPPSAPWDANKCVDTTGELEPGDSCDIDGGKYTGIDMCRVGAQCLLTDDDGFGGACVEFCDENMACTSGTATCAVYNNGALPLCLESCDPLVQDCPEGQGCYQGPANDFICFKASAEAGEGAPGQECAYINSCLAGNLCLAPEAVQDCAPGSSGCCAPICEIDSGGAECGNLEMCLSVFDTPVPGFENVGVCSIPGA